MASDSEGLRPFFPPVKLTCGSGKWLPIRKGYDISSFPLRTFSGKWKMASDSEGLRPRIELTACIIQSVENGFRFGRVTTPLTVVSNTIILCEKWLPIRKGYDLYQSLSAEMLHPCEKWLPIRKGYDFSIGIPPNFSIGGKWLPIRKGYDIDRQY